MSDNEHDPTLDDLRGKQPPELQAVIADIDVRLGELHTDARGEVRELDGEEQDRFDRLMRVRDHATVRLREYEHMHEVFTKHPGALQVAYGNLPGPAAFARDCAEVIRMGGDQLRSAALRLLEARGSHLPAAAQDRVAETVSTRLSDVNRDLDGEYVARRLLITESDAYRSAFMHILTEDHPLLTEAEIRAVRAYRELESRAMGEVTPAAGGVGVPTLIDPTILLESGAAAAPLLNAARVVPVTSNVWKGVSSAPVTFTFMTEGARSTDDSPSLTQPEITVHMARAWVPYSFEVEQDYPSFAAELRSLLSQGWTDSLAAKTISGTGSGQPFGIVTTLDATAASEVLVTTAGTVDAAQIFKVWNNLPERFRARASWVMSVSEESNIRSFGAGPNPSAYFTIDLNSEGITKLNGRPVYVTDYMPAYVSGSSGHINHMVVGDLAAGYTIAMRQGLALERVQHVFTQQTAGTGVAMPTGQRGAFAWGRWGADAVVPGALRLLNQT